MFKRIFLVFTFIGVLFLQAGKVDLNVNNRTFEFGAFADAAELLQSSQIDLEEFYVGGGMIDPESRTALYFAQILVMNPLENLPSIHAGVSLKLLLSKKGSQNFTAFAPGLVLFRGFEELETPVPIGVRLEGYYSPGPMTMRSAVKYTELRASLEFEIMEGGSVYTGYRSIVVEWDDSTIPKQFDNSVFVGFKLKF